MFIHVKKLGVCRFPSKGLLLDRLVSQCVIQSLCECPGVIFERLFGGFCCFMEAAEDNYSEGLVVEEERDRISGLDADFCKSKVKFRQDVFVAVFDYDPFASGKSFSWKAFEALFW